MAPPPSSATAAAVAPPPSTTNSSPPVIALALRGLTFLALLISVILIGTNNMRGLKFNDIYAYSYMFSSCIIGIIYTVSQIGLKTSQLTTGKNQSGLDGWDLIDFYGDKVLSYLLATGAAAGFGFTVDSNRVVTEYSGFLNKGNAGASLLFIAFFLSAVSSIFSSFALAKRSS